MADDTFQQLLDGAGTRARAIPPAPAGGEVDTARLLDPDALAAPAWDDGVDPALLAGPSAVASLGVRTRAVAYTRPLHELEANKGRLGGEAWARLNLIELGFHAIDVVALRMDFDAGARHDDVIAAIASLAALQDPQLDDTLRVGERVLEGLITGRSTTDAEAHQGTYGAWGPSGYVAKRFDYALLTEHIDADGDFYLRATDAAITVLVGALELDVESAQIAAELRLKELVRRGLLTAAIEEAKRAGYRSIQYQEQLRRQLADVRLHISDPGAMSAVDRLVDHALEHVVDRYRAERSIIANVSAARDEAPDRRVQHHANQLIEQLEDCERRHQRLQHHLLRARRSFRDAHADQLASPPAPPSVVDLERHVLRPVLEATLQDADQFAATLFRLSGAPHAPALVDLDHLTDALCAVPVEQDQLGDQLEGERSDLMDTPLRQRFTDDAWEEVEDLLISIDEPVRLSALVDRAEASDTSGVVAHLLALHTVHALDPGLSERLRTPPADDRAILAVAPSGESFTSATLAGDDLWLGRGWIRVGEPEMAGEVGDDG